MTRTEFVAAIAEKLHMNKKDVANVVEEAFLLIGNSLAKGEKCSFVGFGTFEVRHRAARQGRNPRDPGKTVKIPGKNVPVFRPGKQLKDKVLH